MPANLNTLMATIRRSLWRHGNILGERLRHVIDENGNHHLLLTLMKGEVDYHPPPDYSRAKPLRTPLGPSAGWNDPKR
jgi:hypothetical protein